MGNENLLCFYVAQDGNDAWSGRQPRRDGSGGDGPFATLKAAVEAARSDKTDRPKKIMLLGGSYYDTSVELKAEDSGIAVEAVPGEKPVLYGGKRITGWKKEQDGDFWFAELPEAAAGNWDFRLLSVNGRFCRRARLPEVGTYKHLTVFDVPWMSTTAGGWKRKPTNEELTTVKYRAEDLGPWLDIKNAELTIFHKWDESLAGIASHDMENHTLTLSNPCGHPPGAFGNPNYIVWNVREGMTEPGLWYLDRTLGRVVYWPVPGEDMEKAEIIVPTVFTILSFSEKVRGVTLKDIKFAVTKTPLIAGDFAAWKMPGAIQGLEGLEECRFQSLAIENTAGHGIKLLGRCRDVAIEDCTIDNTGAGGILFYNELPEPHDTKNQADVPDSQEKAHCSDTDCTISNNLVQHTGLLYPSAIGIASHYCNIIHNEIRDTTYTGISSGRGKARIEHNLISRAMQVLNDGAAIYVTFCKDGVVRGNVIRDIRQSGESDSIRNAIYLDEQCEDWVVEGNLVVDCTHPQFNHMAGRNTIRNNVFISDSYIKMNFIRCADYRVDGNIFYAKGKIIFAGNRHALASCDRNILYSATGEYESLEINEQYREVGVEPLKTGDRTIKEDPGFIDAAGGNYMLRADSPAFALGIEPLDTGKAGRRTGIG